MWANVRIVWGAASIALSACLYLLDLGTTISTLVTYYYYEYHCPHAHPSSALLRRDPICRAVRSDPVLHSLGTEFWGCLSLLILAHLIYAFIFWISLQPRDHPLRLAYFMPLIHLYRLLKLLCHSFSFKDLKALQQSQRETNSLYNALGASLETAPQFSIQFVVAIKLGEYIRGSSDPNMQAQRIPTKLIVSLVASMISACYSMSTAASLLQMPSSTRLCVGLLVGKFL